MDYRLIYLRVTDLSSGTGFRLSWLSSGGTWLRVWVGAGASRLRLGCRLSGRLSLRLRLSLFMSSRRIGAACEVCRSVGSGTEVSIGAGWDVSVRTRGHDSKGARGGVGTGRVVEQRAHGRTCYRGGRGARHWATDHCHGLHCHLLGLSEEETTSYSFWENRGEQTHSCSCREKLTMMTACWFTIACCCWANKACWASAEEQEEHSKQEGWTQITFDEFWVLMFLFTLATNQMLQVPLQQQEATSHLPQEGLSQLCRYANKVITVLSDSDRSAF